MRKEKLKELERHLKEYEIKKIEETNVKPRFLNIKTYNIELANEQTLKREEIVKGKTNGSAVIILPITAKNDIILAVQPRVFTKKGVCLELPAGYIDEGEKPLISAKRELKEETGYTARKKDFQLLGTYYQDQGCSRAYNHIFLAENVKKKYNQDLDNDEYIKIFKCHLLEAYELADTGYINDAGSLLALEKAKKYIKKRGK
jgi:ADP-ribose pyrophosphatase